MDLYSYVSSNPNQYVDPYGLRRWPYGAGWITIDNSCSGYCNSIAILPEDSGIWDTSVKFNHRYEADAIGFKLVGGVQEALKVPDNCAITVTCTSEGGIGYHGYCRGWIMPRPSWLVLPTPDWSLIP